LRTRLRRRLRLRTRLRRRLRRRLRTKLRLRWKVWDREAQGLLFQNMETFRIFASK
jgi:hypothetical protein